MRFSRTKIMSEECQRAEDFLNAVFETSKLDLSASASETDDGCVLNLEGDDDALLRAEGGELLHALEHLLNQARGRSLPHGKRFICDVGDFRATREAELRAMARLAAERVRASHTPFTFGPMDASERRVIHLALADEEDVQTESVGEGNARRLKVVAKTSARK
jgi:spoIIIJ-associated protein